MSKENYLEFNPHDDSNNEQNGERFESDTQKLIHRHLENEDDVITDEDIRNVRIGMSPPPDAPTEEALQESEERVADRKTTDIEETLPGEQKITPWDVVEPDA
jgi:hypothetical protein